MTSRVQTLRLNGPSERPAAGSQPPGVAFANFADLQFGVFNSVGEPVDVLAVRVFSGAANYTPGDFVIFDGDLCRAKAATGPGSFDAAAWEVYSPGGVVEPPDPPEPPPVILTQMEPLVITDFNVIPPLSKEYAPGMFVLYVNGMAFSPVGDNPPVSVSGTTVTWLSPFWTVSPGDAVVAVYTYLG
jgi:hypothetical protein